MEKVGNRSRDDEHCDNVKVLQMGGKIKQMKMFLIPLMRKNLTTMNKKTRNTNECNEHGRLGTSWRLHASVLSYLSNNKKALRVYSITANN
jgi:hypothetical protein